MPRNNELHSPEPRLSLADWRHAERLFHTRRENLVPVAEPMVLISQIQRSGGTLLNSLLDGHRELHVHPWEIQVGHPSKYEWPVLDPNAGVEPWLETLAEPWLPRAFETGYRKDRYGGSAAESIPLTIVPSFVERLFRVLVATQPPTTSRQILDRYFTAFFNAWLDCQGLAEGGKLWLAGFCPRLAWGESRARWWADYPDGRLIAIVRDPRGWYASARSHAPDRRYSDLDAALAEWATGTDEIVTAKRERPDRTFVVVYDQLVAEPEAGTRALAAWLGIECTPSLLEPTFNRRPVPPNSSFDVPSGGIRSESADRWRDELAPNERSAIEREHLGRYEAACELAGGADAAPHAHSKR
jgi:hypothetical protein